MQVPIVILCGGYGIFVDGEPDRIPKALVPIAGEAMIIHVIRHYLHYGYDRFILALGYRQDRITELFTAKYAAGAGNGVSGDLSCVLDGKPFTVVFQNTGLEAMTGDRVRQVAPHLESVLYFGVSYSDTLSTVDLATYSAEFQKQGKGGSLLAAHVPVRFRVLGLRPADPLVRGFASTPIIQNDYINGGYYFFKIEVLRQRFFSLETGLILEDHVLDGLVADKELVAFRHQGLWQHLDSTRDIQSMEAIVAQLKQQVYGC